MANCNDYISADDLKTGKQAILHIEHVAKSRDAAGNPALEVTDTIRGESVTNKTLDGLKNLYNQAISQVGYITLKSFQTGAPLPGNQLTLPNQVLQDETNGEYYRWDGDFPKTVAAGSTPATTGGVGSGAWLSVGDATLRDELNNEGVINFSHTDTYGNDSVGAHLQNVVYPTDAPFNAATDGVTDATVAIKSAIAHCISKGKKLVLNHLFMITDTLVISDGLHVKCLTGDSGVKSDVPAGKYAVKITGANSGWFGGKILGKNLPDSTTVRQDGVLFDENAAYCFITGTEVTGFFAKGLHTSDADGVGYGIYDKGHGTVIAKCYANSKFCVALGGTEGRVIKNHITNNYLTSGEARPWSLASNYWDGIVSENAHRYVIAFNEVSACGQSGIYFGGNGGYSTDNIIVNNTVYNCWNRGIDMGLFSEKSATNDVLRNIVKGNNTYNNRENNIWLAGVSNCSVVGNTSWFDANYDVIFAGYPGGHICISLASGANGEACVGNTIDSNTCIDPRGNAGITVPTGATGNVFGSGNNLSQAGDIYIASPDLITSNRFELSVTGSFTPVLLPASGSISLSSSSTGVFRATGKRIDFSITVNVSSISSPSGMLNIAYLPGMSGKTSSISMFIVDYWNNIILSNGVIPLASLNLSNQDQIVIYRTDGGRVLYDFSSLLTSTSSFVIKGFVDFN
ncbi:putative tail fiber [Salmonella phage vB_SenS_Sergei]|nr:putative tail fiber [Salmonella phage vB_SenS_Sergei]